MTFPQSTARSGSYIRSVPTHAALRAERSVNLSAGDLIVSGGSITVGDARGGVYWWSPASMATDNGTTVIRPSDRTVASAGRWLLSSGDYTTGSAARIRLEDFGAVGDGITDDAPALRRAMAAVKALGGGILSIGPGRFFLNSGDPRGLNWQSVTGRSAFYTICEAVSGVTVAGEGDATVLLIDPQRLGPNIVSPVGRQDGGCVFANFRVSTPDNNAPTPVAYFAIRDFKVEWLPVADQTHDLTEGQIVRIESNSGAVSNGTVVVENITAQNAPGHQIFNAGRVDLFNARNVRIVNPGKASNAANKDHSCFYVSGSAAIVAECSATSPVVSTGTFVELHCQTNVVQGNAVKGLSTFCNAVSQVIHPGPAYDNSVFLIHNNVAEGISGFVTDYCYGQNRKRLLSIKNNIVLFSTPLATTTEHLLINANDTGLSDAAILPTARLIIEANNVECMTSDVAIADISQSNTLIQPGQAVDVAIQRNRFTNARRGIFSAFSTKLARLRVAENEVRGGCVQGLSDTDNTLRTSRTLFYVVAAPGHTWQSIEFVRNRLQNSYAGVADGYGIVLNNQTGTSLAVPVVLIDNDIELTNPGKELFLITGGASSWATGIINIKHEWRRDFGTDPYSRVTLNITTPNSIKPGSEGRYQNTLTRVVHDGTNNQFPTEFWGDTVPATGFYHRGSVMHLISVNAGGYERKVCVVAGAGSNATWRGAGLIEA